MVLPELEFWKIGMQSQVIFFLIIFLNSQDENNVKQWFKKKNRKMSISLRKALQALIKKHDESVILACVL